MRWDVLLLAAVATRAIAESGSSLNSNGDCDAGFVVCTPAGATSAITPQIGDAAFQNLFTDIVQSSLPASKRSLPLSDRAIASLCCNALLSCLAITALGLPMCYDKFTTNYFLPDGSYGTVVGGSYTSSGGDKANLETGYYTLANGQTGNIYSNDPAAKPNTAALPMPSQFTASGVGSAVPISSLGSKIILTYTTTLPGSVVPPVTISPSTISGLVSQETGVTESSSVIPGTTLPASTASGIVITVTTTQIAAASASTTKKSVAARSGRVERTVYFLSLVAIFMFLKC